MSTTPVVEPMRSAATSAGPATAKARLRVADLPVIRTVSSITFGMIMLALILAYASFGSALPQLRGALEMTEMQVFRHWMFGGLIGAFALSLTLASVLRIRWRAVNAGALIVHAGLLMLCFSAWWYFATKIEGDVALLTPRVQLSQIGGPALRGGAIAARVGETWEQTMPALGGRVRLEVTDVAASGLHSAAEATVRVTVGDGPPEDVRVQMNETPTPISDRLALSLSAQPPVDRFFDNEQAALHYRATDDVALRVAPIRGLPFFRERFIDDGSGPILDRNEQTVTSKRTWPHMRLAGFDIPTGWVEMWRMPIDVETEDLPFDVRVTGFLPYIAGMRETLAPGGTTLNPAAEIEIGVSGQTIREWLVALDPIRARLNTALPFEFRWIENAAERDALCRPLAGPDELIVEIRDAGIVRTLAIRAGETYTIEGTPYSLTIEQLSQNWPLMTPGYEGASSPVALVQVDRGDKKYTRTVVQRFPHLSQDIDETGMRRKDGPYDPNLVLTYRTSARGGFLLTAGEGIEPELAVFSVDGAVRRHSLGGDAAVSVEASGFPLTIRLARLLTNAQRVMQPIVEPLEHRRPNVGRSSASAIRLEFTGRGENTGWRESRWVEFSQYPHMEARPVLIQPPGDVRAYEFIYSRLPHALDAKIGAGDLAVDFLPGRRSVERWRSRFLVQPEDAAADAGDGKAVRAGMVQTNETYSVGRWTFFQSGAAQDHWSFTVLGVGNRNGIVLQTLACMLITLGCLYAFYVKPILKRREQAAALARIAGGQNFEPDGAAGGRA
jgi:hypothetical protein